MHDIEDIQIFFNTFRFIPFPVVVTDIQGDIVFLNKAFEEITGYKSGELMGKNPRILKSGEHSGAFYSDLWNKIKDGEIWTGEFYNRRKNGEFYRERAKIAPVITQENNIRYFIKICEDITAIKEEEENLKRTRDKAIESADLKNRFIANMSHEIRAPLNAIIGFSEMIANRELSTEKKKEFVRIITGNGKNLIKIIDDIIDIAQIEANQLKIQLEPRYPSVLIRELKAIYDVQKLSINKRHIRIIESIPADTENLQIMNDCVRMQQIMNNLISNALKYTENGSICIGYEMKETMIEFFVRDTGIGIAKENHDLIFEYYTRKPGPLEEKSSGTGLGLAISKGLVHLLGGEIRLESEPGKGTEFRFTIPIREVNGEKVPVENADCNIGRTYEDKTILVVEDVDYNYELIEMMLEDLKAKILWAKNGREALQIFRENPVDLVLMDINLPDVNGIDTTKEIHKINAEIPVIAETAYAFTDELKKIMEAGFVDIIVKPIVTDKLVYLVKKYLR